MNKVSESESMFLELWKLCHFKVDIPITVEILCLLYGKGVQAVVDGKCGVAKSNVMRKVMIKSVSFYAQTWNLNMWFFISNTKVFERKKCPVSIQNAWQSVRKAPF